MSAEPEIQFVVVPDPRDVVFDEDGTPMLVFEEHHPPHGRGWVLYYLDNNGGVESHYLGSDVEDMDWAADAARAFLTMKDDGRDAY